MEPNTNTESTSSVSSTSTEQQQAVLPIVTKEPVAVSAGQQVIYFRRKKVAEADSFRGVAAPQLTENRQILSLPLPEQFVTAIREAVEAAASDILRSYVDANKSSTSIPASMLSFAAVLEQMQAAQTSQRLNGDQIKDWYDASETAKAATVRYGSDETGIKKQAALKAKYISLASNNAAVNQALAVKMLSYLSEQDTNSSVCKAVASRLERLSKADTSEDL